MSSSVKLAYLDSLRGIASIVVVISHITLLYFPYLHNFGESKIPEDYVIQSWLHNSPFGFFYSGSTAVYIFFVMSGIVLSIGASKYSTSTGKLIISRYVRLAMPAAASCIIAYFMISIIRIYNISIDDNLINESLSVDNPGILSAIYYGAVRSVFYLRGSIEYNPVLWTMAIEFYGSIFLYISYRTKKPIISMSIFSALCSIISFNIFCGIFCFLIGMLIFKNIKNLPNKINLPLIFIGIYFSGIHSDSSSYYIFTLFFGKYTYTLLNAIAGVIFVYVVVSSPGIKKVLSAKILQKLGKLSFPIYLVHWSAIYIVSNTLILAGINNTAISIVLSIVLTLLISMLFFYIDKLSISISKAFKR